MAPADGPKRPVFAMAAKAAMTKMEARDSIEMGPLGQELRQFAGGAAA